MKINFIWIKFVCIVCIVNVGSTNSASERFQYYNDKLSVNDRNFNDKSTDDLLTDEQTIDSNFMISSDDVHDENLYKANVDAIQISDDNRNMEINGNPPLKVVEQSTKLQVQRHNKGTTSKRSKKRKTFAKKKKRKRTKQQKNETLLSPPLSEDFILKDEESNYTAENNQNNNIDHNSYRNDKDSTNNSVVMEMVEAMVVDNNYDVNSQQSNQYYHQQQHQHQVTSDRASVREDESNLVTTVRVPLSEQLPVNSKKFNEMKKTENERKDSSEAKTQTKSIPPTFSTNKNRTKINKRLKRRRKFMIGDLSCMKSEFIPAPRIANADIKYIRNEIYGIEKSFLEAEYHCHTGYKLMKKFKRKVMIKNKNLICKKRRWFGQRPMCKEIKSKLKSSVLQQCDRSEAEKCEQLCIKRENGSEAKCYCHKGFRLIGTRCSDINECVEHRDICGNGKCINLPGSYKCLCPQGYKADHDGKCVDINECFLRAGHGPCQDVCTNTNGGYLCSCENLKGTKLSEDGHSCKEKDMCLIENGGCSHTCTNSPNGQAYCSCPDGWLLDVDWKICIDIDECKLQETMNPEQRCNYDCINTIGSFKCVDNTEFRADQPLDNDFEDLTLKTDDTDIDYIKTIHSDDADGNYDIIEGGSFVSECTNGYYFNETMGDCQDINECEIDNGNCSNGTCVNTNGSFFCSCHKGFVLSEDDKYKCIVEKNSSTEKPMSVINVACPPLFPPLHGYLECSRPAENSSVTGRSRITNRPGSQCTLRCPSSHQAVGKFLQTCGTDGKWQGDADGVCMKYPTPKLSCPPSVFIELPPFSEQVEVKLQRPKSDVNYKRDVIIKPSWIKNEKVVLRVGAFSISYEAKHPISKSSVSCTTTINVVDGEPPSVEFCPSTQKYKIEKHHESIKASWVEPKFSDNIKVTEVVKTNEPGTYFGMGSHQIIYEAKDAAGYKNRCTFKIIVNAPKRKGLQLPIKNNKFYY